mmetsp:Transcript_19130/g.38810  ORF Transcript_19130/g.38810 Transcript_19130/m.38810 type:complete len:171 (-) Transcript_19130:153-665(-)
MASAVTRRLGVQESKDILPLRAVFDVSPGGASAPLSEDTVKSAAPSLFPALSSLAAWVAASTERCWGVLFVSILLEINATTLTKSASDAGDGKKLTVAMGMYIASLLGFAAALPKIEVGTAYAVWSALGTAVVSIVGIVLYGERCDTAKMVSICFIIAGVVGLNLTEGDH